MTVLASTTRNYYIAGYNQNVYDYTFQLINAEDVTVMLGDVVQTLNVHYSVSGLNVGSGGSITFTLVDENDDPIYPTQGTKISIFMSMELNRTNNYEPNGRFLAAEVNSDYDRLWLAANQQQTAINRAIRLKDSDPIENVNALELPAVNDRKGKLLGFDAVTGNVTTLVPFEAANIVTPDNVVTFTNKSGNISQWTNDSDYITHSDTIEAGNF
jgi:hypothetical protein